DCRASSGPLTSLTPPALPRPPACTCAFTTTRPPSRSAMQAASSAEAATSPGGVGTPYLASNCFAWYSWIFKFASSDVLDQPPFPQDVQQLRVRPPEPVYLDPPAREDLAAEDAVLFEGSGVVVAVLAQQEE